MSINKRNQDYVSSQRSGNSTHGNGPFLAKVVSHLDPTYMGILEVELLREVGNSGVSAEGQLHQVKMITPFYGVTAPEFLGKNPDDYNNTQKSYGMWFIPPDIGTTVVVFFIDGDAKRGFWLGCVADEGMNFMFPGIAATELVVEGKNKERLPVAEYNKLIHEEVKDPTSIKKPKHLITESMITQGLLRDDTRGITTSSCRREVPSMVFGISTPGPVDKRPGSKKGKVGKKEHKISDVFVSRLGGTTLILDDGDDKYLRKKPAGGDNAGPPDYASVIQNEKGDPTIPHNELVRIRTRTGHQILFHNSEDLIYIGNSKGTAWVELTSNGKIDIFSNDSISVHTKNDINFRADRDINFEAGRNLNISVKGEAQIETEKDFNVVVGKDGKITVKNSLHLSADMSTYISAKTSVHALSGRSTLISSGDSTEINSGSNNNFSAGGSTNIKSGGNHLETASQIHMNGPGAASASGATGAQRANKLKNHILPTEKKDDKGKIITIESILRRVPMHEPYPQHENLDPMKYIPKHTDRDVDGRYNGTSESMKEPAEWWVKMTDTKPQYTAKTDPFLKVKGPEK